MKEVVKEKYGQAALRVKSGGSSCCGAPPASESCCDPITANLYDAAQARNSRKKRVLASLGCGNPTALAKLNPGEMVLDLGRAAASTCCSRRAASGPPAKPTASI